MARQNEAGGVSALVRHTAGMAELAIHAGHPDRKHNEFLPYPDNNFNESFDEHHQRGLRKYISISHFYSIYLI
jgi:hypothetical protein